MTIREFGKAGRFLILPMIPLRAFSARHDLVAGKVKTSSMALLTSMPTAVQSCGMYTVGPLLVISSAPLPVALAIVRVQFNGAWVPGFIRTRPNGRSLSSTGCQTFQRGAAAARWHLDHSTKNQDKRKLTKFRVTIQV
jgi:hypothetical protein